MENYEVLLDIARKKLPESVLVAERFEIPRVRGHIQGNRTVITNFLQIANTLRRDPQRLLKFILKELATPGDLKKSGSLILGTKVSSQRINEKIKQYVDEYVICKECGRPDTSIEEEGDAAFLKCHACGAKKGIKVI